MKDGTIKQKIGIMGGTFNPIHNAHLILAQQACEQFELDKAIFIPSGTPAYKNLNEVASPEHRYEMTKLAISGNDRFDISDIEIRRSGNTYTVDTISELKNNMPDAELYFIIGGDSLFMFENWRLPDKILKMCHLLAAGRNNYNPADIQKKADELNNKFNSDIRLLSAPMMEVSSSFLRNLVKEGKSIRYYVPDAVAEYISEKGLYLQL